MLKDLLGAVWRRAPRPLRRWTIRLSHPRFAVTVGAIITDSRGQVLLLKHRFRPGAGWGMPGGFMEAGEQPEQTLRRELREEISLEVEDLVLFVTRSFRRPRQVEIVFTGQAVGNPEQLSFEIQKASWFSPQQLPSELPRDQVKLIKLAFANGARPQD